MRVARGAFLVGLLLAVTLIGALNLTGPTISPPTAFTNTTLNCSWSYSGDTTEQNITIYNGSTLYNTTYQNTTLSTFVLIPSSLTNKNENWKCSVEIFNATASTATNVSITITNSPPTTEGVGAGIFNDSGTDVGTYIQIEEDTSLNLDVNATDDDSDTLTYLAASPSDFCSLLSSTLGTYTCSPLQSDITGNQPTLTNVSFIVDDGTNFGGRKILFNITPVNDPPVAGVADQLTDVNVSLNYTFISTDEENSFPLSFALIFNASNSEIQDKLTITPLDGNGTNTSIYYDAASPDFNDIGVWPVFVNVTDNSTDYNGQNDSLSAVYTFQLNITAVGRPPYFTNITPTGQYNISQGEFLQINVSANDPDVNSTLIFLVDTNRFNISGIKNDTNSTDAQAQINFTPTNNDVGVYNVTVTVIDDELLQNTTILQFNVTNVNDPPIVHEFSYSQANTQGNQNASNTTAYANSPFVYDVNATDIDEVYGDTLNYTDNTSLFNISVNTGRISFTPTPGQVQAAPYHINITVQDDAGVEVSRTVLITINANLPPYFNQTLPALNCTTDAICGLDLGGYTDDPDAGDNVSIYNLTFVTGSLGSFAYNTSTGLINFTPGKIDVGNYTINVTIEDTFGASNWSLMNLSINNTPVAPNLTRFNFSISNDTIVETYLFTFELRGIDEDLLVSSANENITFTTNLSLPHLISQLSDQNETARALFSFTPSIGAAGNYTIEINATDTFGFTDTEIITFEIFEKVPPPNITNVTPWGAPPNYTIQTTFADALPFSGSIIVNGTENTSILFALIVNDTRPVTYNWTVNGTQNVTTENFTFNSGFFDAGLYEITVNVSNDRRESSKFTWYFYVQNLNRPPTIINNLTTPLQINTTFQSQNYFIGGGLGTQRFYDPDDDTDSNGAIDGNETNTLVFSTQSSCAVASFGIAGVDLTVTPQSVGTCLVVFNATDLYGENVESNIVLVNVTDVPSGEQESQTVVSSGGGGGSSITSRFIPLNNERTKPEAFHLIAPKLVTIYNNNSLQIPIVINNTWVGPLKFVQIWALANKTGVTVSIDEDVFEEIPVNESREVMLTVENYRLGENYEVEVRANVSDPEYEDEALILLNSIEQASEGDEVNVKVTFANDLLSEHPECQELNEVLDAAKTKLNEDNIAEARRLVDGVINGCKYLVSMQQKTEERPSKINPIITIDDLSMKTIMWSVLAFVMLLSIALLTYYHYSYKPEEDI